MENGVTGHLGEAVAIISKSLTYLQYSSKKPFFRDGKSSCTRTRTRFCNNPVPSNGGADCVGSAQESEECSPDWLVTQDGDDHPQCVVHGGWTVWSPGSECNTQCETTKTRTCTNPVPINSKV